jgi:hypothetical protein
MARKLSRQNKQLLVKLIITCELNRLTEKESLALIKRKIGTSISRRTYYAYKSALYNSQILKKTKPTLPGLGSGKFKSLFPQRTYLNSEHELAQKYSDVIKLDFIPQSAYKILSDATNTIANSRNFFGRLNKLKETSRKNYESVPKNATIRSEYIKCGNYSCRRCTHGPYYYAHWREKGKQIKKYLGKYDPRNKETVKMIDLTPFTSQYF